MLMVVFNALNDQPDHALLAAQTAVEIQTTLSALQKNPRSGMPFVFDFGVGINTGEAVVGCLGFENRFEYTAIGDNINIASRLSGIAEAGQILIAENTYLALAGALNTRSLGPLNVRGKTETVFVYEIFL
jgi:adenylate cyclase